MGLQASKIHSICLEIYKNLKIYTLLLDISVNKQADKQLFFKLTLALLCYIIAALFNKGLINKAR